MKLAAGAGVQQVPVGSPGSPESEVEHHQKAIIREANIFMKLRIECKFQINMHGQSLFSTLFLCCFFFSSFFLLQTRRNLFHSRHFWHILAQLHFICLLKFSVRSDAGDTCPQVFLTRSAKAVCLKRLVLSVTAELRHSECFYPTVTQLVVGVGHREGGLLLAG